MQQVLKNRQANHSDIFNLAAEQQLKRPTVLPSMQSSVYDHPKHSAGPLGIEPYKASILGKGLPLGREVTKRASQFTANYMNKTDDSRPMQVLNIRGGAI